MSTLGSAAAQVPLEKGDVPIPLQELGTNAIHASQHNNGSITSSAKRDHSPGLEPQVQTAMSKSREALFIGSLCLGQFVTLAPLGQVLAPLRIVGQSFGEDNLSQLSWYMAAFALTSGTFVLIGGGLGDRFGYKRCFLLAVAWLGIWSFVAGFAVYTRSEVFFDICRALQGVGAAILTPNALAIIGASYPPGPKKGIFFCLFGSMGATGFFTTSVFASLLAQLAWWPWSFWIYTIITVVIFVVGFLAIPDRFMHRVTEDGSGPPPFDWLGAITGTSGLILFNVAWNQAPTVGWNSPYVIVLLVVGVALLTAFVHVEQHAAAPLVPMSVLNIRVILVLSCILFGFMSFGTFLYYWFQFVEIIQGVSPLGAVAEHIPALISALGAAGVVASIVTRVRSCWLMFGAMLAFITANILLATLDPKLLYWKQLFWTTAIIPFGMDMTFPAASLMLSNLVPEKHQGVAAGLMATLANYSIALGLGIAGTVEVNLNDGGKDTLRGYRGAMYFSCGSAGMGLLIASYLVLREYTKPTAARSMQA